MNTSSEIKTGIGITVLLLIIVAVAMINNFNLTPQTSKVSPTPTISATTENTKRTYTTSEVAKHNSASDCWFIVNNNVYNVTDYENAHPGGSQNIIDYCGTDATVAYTSMRKHGSRANSDLASLIIGTLSK
jgi:cytochrome b involved in lipid metabolism